MKPIDSYSYHCGVIDCFNEMLQAGLKKIAFSHPFATAEERDALLPFSQEICQKYHTRFYPDNAPLLTDLFPVSLNRNTFLIVFYQNEDDLAAYLRLKKQKQKLLDEKEYTGSRRTEIAYALGTLLSYPEDAILKLIAKNTEKE